MTEENQNNKTGYIPIDQNFFDQEKQKLNKLSKREIEILHFIVAGASNKIIAEKLGLSQRTVENHRLHIMEKTGYQSQTALTCFFLLVVKNCLKYCAVTKQCNHTYNDCPIEIKLLKP